MAMTSQELLGDTKAVVVRVLLELPLDDGAITRARDEELTLLLVLVDLFTTLDGGDPATVALQQADKLQSVLL